MKRNSRLGLLQRAAPEAGVKWFEVAPFVAFHAAAAWEEHSNVHVIICRSDFSLSSGLFSFGCFACVHTLFPVFMGARLVGRAHKTAGQGWPARLLRRALLMSNEYWAADLQS